MKALWHTTYGWFFDLIAGNINTEDGGNIVKYLGDGVMIVYEIGKAAEAINAAIEIQEAILDAAQDNKVLVNCSIGIATGEVVEFKTPGGNVDYIGSVADKAARLCSYASPKAVFVDRATVSAALMVNVKSKYGSVVNRTDDDYAGSLEKITLKGFGSPVPYHEILWGQQHYGLKSQVGTDTANKIESMRPNTTHAHEVHAVRSGDEKIAGTVTRWLEDKEYGFVTDSKTQQPYYVNLHSMADTTIPKVGDKVYFLPHPPLAAGKSPVASCLVVVGHTMRGEVTFINDGKGFGYVGASDSTKKSVLTLFMYVGGNPDGLEKGDMVEFEVEDHPKGPVASKPVKIE